MNIWLMAYLIGVAINTVIVHGIAQNPEIKPTNSSKMFLIIAFWPYFTGAQLIILILEMFTK